MNKIIILLLTLTLFCITTYSDNISIGVHEEHILEFGDSVFEHGVQDNVSSTYRSSETTDLTHIIYGFVPYWESSYNSPRWDLISRMAYFNLSFNSSGDITSTNSWYSASVVDYAMSAGIPVDLCIACFDDASIANLLSDETARGNCIHNAINALITRGGSGINIDFELPPSGSGANLTEFCRVFRDSLDARTPGAWLSICMPAVDWRNNFYPDELSLYCNALFIMGYDYYWSGSSYTGPNDPLDDPTETYDIAHSVDTYLAFGSSVASKIILGLPLYGRDWACSGAERRAATTATGTSVLYYTAVANAETYGRLYDTDAQSPWYRYGSWHQTWYSDSMSLDARYQFAIDNSLMGVGYWALGYDNGDPSFWGGIEYRFTEGSTIPDSSDTITLDDGNAGYSSTGSWVDGTYAPENGWWGDYKYCSTGGEIQTATWQPEIVIEGEYDLYFWWLAGSNRCSSIPVQISGIEDTTVHIDQQGTGAQWHFLGTFPFAEGSSGFVRITDNGASGGDVIIADAARFVFSTELSDIETHSKPENFDISIYPNPFNSSCKINNMLSEDMAISIFDLKGNLILSGKYKDTFDWTPQNKCSGIYRVVITIQNNTTSRNILYIK